MNRNNVGWGLISLKQCVRSEEAGLSEHVRDSEEWMLKVFAEDCVEGECKEKDEEGTVRAVDREEVSHKFSKEVKNVVEERL